MTLHIHKFVDRVRGHEARGSRDFVMSMADAKDLHADITRLLLIMQELQQRATAGADEAIEVKIAGGTF